MAEEAKTEVAETVTAAVDMAVDDSAGNGDSKRPREEEPVNEDDSKKHKVEENAGDSEAVALSLGPKTFGSAVDMFDYFFKLLHFWPANLDVNEADEMRLSAKAFESTSLMSALWLPVCLRRGMRLEYERMVLLDLIKKGHPEPDKKIGSGIRSFQVRVHPTFKSKCYFLIRDDEVVDDFSFRKCVDHILPLPVDMRGKSDVDRALGGGKGRGGRGGHGRGRGRGGRGRH